MLCLAASIVPEVYGMLEVKKVWRMLFNACHLI